MKPTKKSNKKLFLNKVTFTRLELVAEKKIYGGQVSKSSAVICETSVSPCLNFE